MKPLYFFFCMLFVMSCSKSSDDNKAFAFTPLLNSYTGSTASVTHQQEIIHSETELQDIANSPIKKNFAKVYKPQQSSFRTGGGIRTPINGFGDRYSTLELHPYFKKVLSFYAQNFFVLNNI